MTNEIVKAYKYRIYPNKEQTKIFNETLETCRRLYNNFLAKRNEWFALKKHLIYQHNCILYSEYKKKIKKEMMEVKKYLNFNDCSERDWLKLTFKCRKKKNESNEKYRERKKNTYNKMLKSFDNRFKLNNFLNLNDVSFQDIESCIKKYNKFTQNYELPEMKEKDEYLKRAPAIVLQDVSHRIHTSFQNLFRRIKNGDEKPGYPKFKKYPDFNSFTYSGSGNGLNFGFRNGRLYLVKIGLIKIKIHREIPENAKLKICSIIREIDKWYAAITIEYENELAKPKLDSSKAVGIDLGINYLATLSNGEFFENPKWLKQYEKSLAQLNRNHSRKKNGSKNKRKSAIEIAKLHKKITNKKKDYYHNITTNITDKFDYIVLEDLKVKNMIKNKKLAKSISDVSWYMFRSMIEYKAKEKGKIVVLIDPKYTSQNCSNCGVKVEKSLAVRTHKCPECGLVIDRDLNAAINILKRGFKQLNINYNIFSTLGTSDRACQSHSVGKAMKQEAT